MRISDETLTAYVDGELDPAERARVDAAARTDAALARRIQAHKRLRERMAGVFAELVNDPPPTRLVEAVRGSQKAVQTGQRPPATVVDLEDVRRKRAQPAPTKAKPPSWIGWAAMAACAVLAVGLTARFAPPLTPSGAAMVGGPAGSLMAEGALAGALDHQLASTGTGSGEAVRIGVSFHSNEGGYCRTFQVAAGDGFAGLACHEAEGWRIRTAVAQSAPSSGPEYRQAGTEIPAVVLEAAQGLVSGAPLNAQAEAAARDKGWR